MRHQFSQRYTVEELRGERVIRRRCEWCGIGSHWPGAADACSGSVPDMLRRPEQRRTEARARAKLISQRRQELRYAARAAMVAPVISEEERAKRAQQAEYTRRWREKKGA